MSVSRCVVMIPFDKWNTFRQRQRAASLAFEELGINSDSGSICVNKDDWDNFCKRYPEYSNFKKVLSSLYN